MLRTNIPHLERTSTLKHTGLTFLYQLNYLQLQQMLQFIQLAHVFEHACCCYINSHLYLSLVLQGLPGPQGSIGPPGEKVCLFLSSLFESLLLKHYGLYLVNEMFVGTKKRSLVRGIIKLPNQ